MGKTKGRHSPDFNVSRKYHPYQSFSNNDKYGYRSGNQKSREKELRQETQRSNELRSTDERSSDNRSTNHKSVYPTATDLKIADLRCAEHKSDDWRSSDQRFTDNIFANHRPDDCRHNDYRSDDHRSTSHRSTNQRSHVHSSQGHKYDGHRSVEDKFSNFRPADHRSVDHRYADHKSNDHRYDKGRSHGHRSDNRRTDTRRSHTQRSGNHRSHGDRSFDSSFANSRPADQIYADHISAECRSTDFRLAYQRSADHLPDINRPASHRNFDQYSSECSPIRPRNGKYKFFGHRPGSSRPSDLSSTGHRSAHKYIFDQSKHKQKLECHTSVKRRKAEPRSNEVVHKLFKNSVKEEVPVNCRLSAYGSEETKLADQRLLGLSSSEYRSHDFDSFEHKLKYPGRHDINFPTLEDSVKCRLMKVLQVTKPYLKQLLLCIVKDKSKLESLESYAKKQGRDFAWLKKNFTDEQIDTIRRNPNFDNFDLTLLFKSIEVFKEFNPTQFKIENEEIYSNNCTQDIKDIRNVVCHYRIKLTASQWNDKAKSLKKSIENLLNIINIQGGSIDLCLEHIKIGEEVDRVMNENISEKEFRYICLLKVFASLSEDVLNKVIEIIFHDKMENSMQKYFLSKGMTSTSYKNTFFKQEKPILESITPGIQPDLVLYCKMIEAWSTWHTSLKDNKCLRKELVKILKKIRSIRNHAMHEMLSMNSEECRRKAQELGDSLKNLVNFLQDKELDISMNAAKLNFSKIDSDINFIMSVPYPY